MTGHDSNWADSIRGARAAFVFFTRLPLGGYPYTDEEYRWSTAHAPLVGLVVGGLGGLVFILLIGAGPLAAAFVALAVTMLITGGFHEDGLADTADALGGAIFDREKLMEILKDSRLGTYGTLALVISVGLRAALIAQLATSMELGPCAASSGAVALVLAHTLGRITPSWLTATMPYITDAEHARSRPVVRASMPQAVVATTYGVAATVAAIVLAPGEAFAIASAFAVLPLVGALCAWRFQRRAGGVTGDFLGATEQVGEMAVLLLLAVL